MNDTSWSYKDDATTGDAPMLPAHVTRPGMVTVIGVVAIVLAMLGLLSGSMTGLQSLFADQLQKLTTPTPAQREAQPGLQKQLDANQAIYQLAHKYRYVTRTASALHVGLSAALLVSAIGLLRLRPAGRLWMIRICLAVIAFELLRTLFYFRMQMEMLPMLEQVAGAAPGNVGGSMMRSMIVIGMLFSGVWLAFKLALFATPIVYLRRPHLESLFAARR